MLKKIKSSKWNTDRPAKFITFNCDLLLDIFWDEEQKTKCRWICVCVCAHTCMCVCVYAHTWCTLVTGERERKKISTSGQILFATHSMELVVSHDPQITSVGFSFNTVCPCMLVTICPIPHLGVICFW